MRVPFAPVAFSSLVAALAVFVGAPSPSDADPTPPSSPLVFDERALLPQATVDQPYSHPWKLTGATGATKVTLFSPVPGIKAADEWKDWSISASNELVGTPAHRDCNVKDGSGCPQGWTCGEGGGCEGVVSFVALAQDDAGHWDQRMFDIVVTDAANPLSVGAFPVLPPAVQGQPYAQQLYAHGGKAPFKWTLDSGWPNGMSIDPDGTLEGTPNATGDFIIDARVWDATGKNVAGKIQLHVDPATPITVTPDATKPVQKAIPRVGYNVGDETTYWNDVKLTNQWISNPGMEPTRPYRKMYWAWAGTASTIEEWSQAQYAELHELDTGYWDGGTYWVLSGPAKGRTGKIAKYQRVKDSGSPTGWKAIWTLADSDPSKVVENKPDPNDMEKNIFMVEAPPKNATSSNHFTAEFPPDWQAYGDPSTTFSLDTTNKAAGAQSAKVVSSVDAPAGFGDITIWDNAWRRLRKDTTYTLSANVRQTGVGDGKVSLQMTHVYWDPHGPFWSQSFDVPDDGKFHHIEATYVGQGESQVSAQVIIQKKGTLWVDDVLMYESQSGSSVSKAFDPIPSVLDDLRAAHAGCLRFWYFDTQMPLASALEKPSADDPKRIMNLYDNLLLAEQSGANAWIIAAKEWTPDEFVQLAEYLSSTDTTKGMGALRAKHGHPTPWTSTIGHVYIEYSDEAWNWPNWAYPFDLWHPDKYASFSKERFDAIKSSPYYDAKKMTLVLDGQVGDDYWVNDPVDKLTYPSHDAMDEAPYIDTYLNRPLNELAPKILDEVEEYEHATVHTMGIWSARGETTKMLVYEGGPGTSSFRPPAGDEVRKNSMIAATEFLDEVAMLFSHGVGEYNTFTYQNNAAWQDVTGSTSRFHLPASYAISMFNDCCGARDEVTVTQSTNAPQMIGIGYDKAKGAVPDAAVPALLSRAYVGNDGKQAFLLINRNPNVVYRAKLATSDDGVPYRVTTLAATRADRGTLEGPGLVTDGDSAKRDLDHVFEAVKPVSTMVTSAQSVVTVDVPAMGIVTVTDAPVTPPPGGGDVGPQGDAGPPSSDAGPTNGDAPTSDTMPGCGCETAPSPDPVGSFAALGALAVGLAIARRRRAA